MRRIFPVTGRFVEWKVQEAEKGSVNFTVDIPKECDSTLENIKESSSGFHLR